MADILRLVSEQDRIDYAQAYAYQTSFKGAKLFPAKKVENLKVRIAQLVEGGNLPVMAKVHSLDSEARIGDRPDFEIVGYEQMLIKEKINQSERIIKYLGNKATDNDVKSFVYDDFNNMMSRVLTRTEVANMELLSTGKISVNENNVKFEVDYKLPANNKISLGSWASADHDIIGDLNTIMETASAKGVTLVRAFTTSEVVKYMLSNAGIMAKWENKPSILNKTALLAWVKENFGVEFILVDEVYKESANGVATHKFFKPNTITFVNTLGAIGEGLYGVTPEELELNDGKYEFRENMFVALTQWKSADPVAVWTKASALYVPVVKDINSMFIATIGA
jgi:hypothetical protein